MTRPLLFGLAIAIVDDLALEDAERDRVLSRTPLNSVPTSPQGKSCPTSPLLLQSISPRQHQPTNMQPISGNQNADN